MPKLLEEPTRLKAFEDATMLEKHKNVQEFNAYRIQELDRKGKLTLQGQMYRSRLQAQFDTVEKLIKQEEML